MWIHEMTEPECESVLAGASIGRLGCAFENQPYVVPVYVAYEPGYIYVFSTLGQKIEWMRANPKICVQVDEIERESEWLSVIANGQYEELPEPEDAAENVYARQLLGKRYEWWLNALAERRMKLPDNQVAPVFFRLHIHSVTGLHAKGESQSTGAAS
jgi:uncharacterized protein